MIFGWMMNNLLRNFFFHVNYMEKSVFEICVEMEEKSNFQRSQVHKVMIEL